MNTSHTLWLGPPRPGLQGSNVPPEPSALGFFLLRTEWLWVGAGIGGKLKVGKHQRLKQSQTLLQIVRSRCVRISKQGSRGPGSLASRPWTLDIRHCCCSGPGCPSCSALHLETESGILCASLCPVFTELGERSRVSSTGQRAGKRLSLSGLEAGLAEWIPPHHPSWCQSGRGRGYAWISVQSEAPLKRVGRRTA